MRCTGISLSFLIVSLLSACGGGSGDSSPATPGATQPLETTDGITDTDVIDTDVIDTDVIDTDVIDTDVIDTDVIDTDVTDTDIGNTDTSSAAYVTPAGVVQCSVDDIKSRVDFDMRDYYIYYDQVPTLNLGSYDSGNALIKDLRVNPDIYSSVRDAATQTSLFAEGVTRGYGFGFSPSSDNVVRFFNVDIGSPGFNAGILRGDEVITVNDQPIADFSNDALLDIFGPDSTQTVTMSIRTRDEEPRTVSVTPEEYRWVTASASSRYTSESNPSLPVIGYLSVNVFLATTEDEINAALQALENAGGFDELIIDLRYNGGGRTSVAQYLASVVGGAAVEGNVLLENKFNDKYAESNNTVLFESVEKPLNVPRVFVLTTGSTASSSEILINSLKPYIDVVVIGGATGGKPFTSAPQTYCDKSINAMRALRVNSAGVSVQGGIQPDCFIDDSWNTEANSTEDPLVASALYYASEGGCPANIVADAGGLERKAPDGPTFQPEVLVNFAIEE